jgi:hypothetical protein
MRKITVEKTEIESYDDEGNCRMIAGYIATDGVSSYTGATEAEAVAHYGVPVGAWNK